MTDQAGQILHNTPHIPLFWRVSTKHGNQWLQGDELNAQGDGTVTDAEFGTLNEQVDGRLRLLADNTILNNPDWPDFSMGRLGNGNHIVRAPVGLQPTVSCDSNASNPITMVGLKQDKVVDGVATEDVEHNGVVWMDKEKMVPGLFYIPEYDELTSSVLTTTTYNLDSELHHIEANVRNDAQTLSKEGKFISAPAHLESVKTYRKAGMGCMYCNVCHSTLSYDLGACRQCDVPR